MIGVVSVDVINWIIPHYCVITYLMNKWGDRWTILYYIVRTLPHRVK